MKSSEPVEWPQPAVIDLRTWIAGQGTDKRVLLNLARYFPKPSMPLGEAWFMGENRYFFTELNELGIEGVSVKYIERVFWELSGGIWWFNHTPEWVKWYAYLMPRILDSERFMAFERIAEDSWHGVFCTALVGLAVCNSSQREAKFEREFATALAPWVMNLKFWDHGYYRPLRGQYEWVDSWGSHGFDREVSTSLLFALRYLKPDAIPEWLDSILDIEDVVWRAHFLVWLDRVRPIIESAKSDYATLLRSNFDELWIGAGTMMIAAKGAEWCNWHLIPPGNLVIFRDALKVRLSSSQFLSWIDEFSTNPKLWPIMDLKLASLQSWLI